MHKISYGVIILCNILCQQRITDNSGHDPKHEGDKERGDTDNLKLGINENSAQPKLQPAKNTSASYKPYDRIKSNGMMQHKPRLKLEDESTKVTEVVSEPISKPQSLVGNFRLNKKEHGVAVIFSNENFDDPQHKQRIGTDRDEENLVETFRFLGYRVEVRRECTKDVIEGVFDNINTLVNDEDDSFVCCILSHGEENIVYGTDSKEVRLRTDDNSLEMKLTKCRKLNDKPKMFFISTCRGTREGEGVLKPQSDGKDMIPVRAHFVFNYSTLPGEVSWRSSTMGTYYIQKLCHALCKYATMSTLSDIQKKVAEEVAEVKSYHQLPSLEEQITKNVYFFDDMI